MADGWPALPYDAWAPTLDTLHAHSQLLGKLANAFAPPEPELQHAALRLTARGWETLPLPAPDGSGALGIAIDLRTHETLVEHSTRGERRIALTPNRSVGAVTRDVLETVRDVGGSFELKLQPQETSWAVALDEDEEHATYDAAWVETYFAAATRAAQVLAALRAPYRGRSTPVNAWWGSFDLAVNLFSGRPADPPADDFIMRNAMDSEEIAVGWWPGDARYPRAAFYAYAHPKPDGLEQTAHWNAELGEVILDWEEVVATDDPFATALAFGRSFVEQACVACSWDPELAASATGLTPVLL